MKKVTILFMEEDAAYAAVMSGRRTWPIRLRPIQIRPFPDMRLLSFRDSG